MLLAEYKRRQAAPGRQADHARPSASAANIRSPTAIATRARVVVREQAARQAGRRSDASRPLRAVADRPAASRQCPAGAAQLAVRAAGPAAPTSCGSTTPIPARSTEEFARGIEDDLAWLGITPDHEGPAVRQNGALRRGARPADRRGPALSGLRDRGRARDQARPRPAARQAADLRSRRAGADRRAEARATRPRAASRTGASGSTAGRCSSTT